MGVVRKVGTNLLTSGKHLSVCLLKLSMDIYVWVFIFSVLCDGLRKFYTELQVAFMIF